MRPDPPKVLSGVAMTLLTQVMPEVQSPFGAQTVSLAGGLTMMVAEEFDRAAARLVEENAVVLALLQRARGVFHDAAIEEKLESVMGDLPGADLRVSALQAENDRLRGVLIDVHAAAENEPGKDGATLCELIWDELKQSTRRRHFSGRVG
jgi:hypothetical protein